MQRRLLPNDTRTARIGHAPQVTKVYVGLDVLEVYETIMRTCFHWG
jgi:hypothetical protein